MAAEQWIERTVERAMMIQQVPAPTFAESARAALVQQLLVKEGLADVQIDLAVTGNGRLKIADSQFEPLVEESLCPQQKQLDIRFQVVPGSHYLAIKAPVVLDSLRLTAATRP